MKKNYSRYLGTKPTVNLLTRNLFADGEPLAAIAAAWPNVSRDDRFRIAAMAVRLERQKVTRKRKPRP